jgi:hypothetical protein
MNAYARYQKPVCLAYTLTATAANHSVYACMQGNWQKELQQQQQQQQQQDCHTA